MQNLALAGAALAMGVAAMPHCAAMCAGPCAALSGGCRRSAAGFHLGRLLGYTAGGAAVAGGMAALGAWSQAAPVLRPLWTLLHLGLLALGLWWLWRGRQLPWTVRGGAVPMQAETVRAVHMVQRMQTGTRTGAGAETRETGTGTGPPRLLRAGLAGLAWVAWPCGALQAALLLAAMASGAAGGAMVMAAFAVGSMPALALGPWLWARWSSARRRGAVSAPEAASAGLRVAGASLAATSGWALGHGLWNQVAAWCAG